MNQLISIVLILVSAAPAFGQSTAPAARAKEILEETGVQGGFIVHLGCRNGALTAALGAGSSYQVHGLAKGPAMLERARKRVLAQGLYGKVSFDRLEGRRLPYVDNMVNLLYSENPGRVKDDEIMRVLVPNGVAYVKRNGEWVKTIKPRPDNIDDWTHYLHSPSNNAVAQDTVVGPPRHLQWVGSPRWSRHHDRMASLSAMVSAGGRIFYIMDEGSRVSIQMPARWTLIARDAFNGTLLWKQPIPDWQDHLFPLKSGPTQLARRLVASDEKVFVTLGYKAPVTALDSATGEILKTYKGTGPAEEILHSDGTIFVVTNPGASALDDYVVQLNLGDQARVRKDYEWNRQERKLQAIDAETGRVKWEKTSTIAPLATAADDFRVLYHDGERIHCLDRESGEELWRSEPTSIREQVTFNFGPRMVLQEDVVLFAGGDSKDKTMKAFDLRTGKELWSEKHDRSGYQSPEDLLVVGGLVWSAPMTSGKDSGHFTGRDLYTGEVKIDFPPDVDTYWFHHRCYISKATTNFIMPSRTGIEFVDIKAKTWQINHWVRGGCLYGVMPCNGMVYAPPHNCACYPEAKLYGLNALAPASDSRASDQKVRKLGRFIKGPAYGAKVSAAPDAPSWPTYRGSAARSGYTPAALGHDLDTAWSEEIGGRLSSVTVADGMLFVAQVDAHTVHALDAASGKRLWQYTAGGRVDSPPTFYQGRVLFGSADGRVYCLRASDGELIWRFRAAPQDKRLMSFEQLESVWPVHGSILVEKDVAHFVAGRSNFLDGGLWYYQLAPATGEVLRQVRIDDKDPETGEDIQDRIDILNMPVGLPDVLSSDGEYLYMRSQRFDFEGNREDLGPHSGDPVEQASVQTGIGTHLFSPTGFLDDSWFHRSYWVYGRSFAGGHAGYSKAGKFAPAGRILVADKDTVYGFGRKPEYFQWTTTMEHQLFAVKKDFEVIKEEVDTEGLDEKAARRAKSNMKQHPGYEWATDVPLLVRAMVKAGDTLFIAGPPDLIDEEETFKRIAKDDEGVALDLKAQDAALRGEHGALLRVVAAGSGEKLAEYKLEAPPVFDGMAAAGGRLYVACTDGSVVCMEGK